MKRYPGTGLFISKRRFMIAMVQSYRDGADRRYRPLRIRVRPTV